MSLIYKNNAVMLFAVMLFVSADSKEFLKSVFLFCQTLNSIIILHYKLEEYLN